ncbi:hypothetical protein KA057_01580 [Candidatus Gracilibacteria bacterium]|nr:hypothetical protein [Candidatus Gracilibacteria bacterium]
MTQMGLDIKFEKQPDGAVWKRYTSSSGLSVLVTQTFRELMKHGENIVTGDFQRPKKATKTGADKIENSTLEQIRRIMEIPPDNSSNNILKLLSAYRESFEAGAIDDGVREYVNTGGEAAFYGIGESNVGVREVNRSDFNDEDALYRMDQIAHLLELGGLPRWVHTPIQYGILTIPRDVYASGRTGTAFDKFMIMEKIDSGVSVFDIVDNPRSDKLSAAIKREFGFKSFNTDEYRAFQSEISVIFEEVKKKLHDTCIKHKDELPPGTSFETLFTDLLSRNMLVTLNKPPIGGSKYSFWIIDQ